MRFAFHVWLLICFLVALSFNGKAFTITNQNPKHNQTDANGLKQGKWKLYHENGKIQAKGKYKDDIKIGRWKYYNKLGLIEREEKYREGKLLATFIYENGRVMETIDKNGKSRRKKCNCT